VTEETKDPKTPNQSVDSASNAPAGAPSPQSQGTQTTRGNVDRASNASQTTQTAPNATAVQNPPDASRAPSAPESFAEGQSTPPDQTGSTPSIKTDIEMLRDVELGVTAELGRTKMTIGEITSLTTGSIVTLTKGAGEPADLRINDQLFASGEVIVMDGYFAVKITKLLSKEERVKNFS
jgi:flagellar motor switch protein FliN/FliY